MGQARHPLSLLLVLAMIGAALAAGGCGSSNESSEGTGGGAAGSKTPAGAAARGCSVTVTGIEDLRVSGVDCEEGGGVVTFWSAQRSCRAPVGASRVSCTVGNYRCLGARADRGLVVSCARPGRSISFVARRG